MSEIKKQYYSLAKKHHPDALNKDASEAEKSHSKDLFKQVTEAYAVLSDEAMRKKYDTLIFGESANNREFENEDAY